MKVLTMLAAFIALSGYSQTPSGGSHVVGGRQADPGAYTAPQVRSDNQPPAGLNVGSNQFGIGSNNFGIASNNFGIASNNLAMGSNNAAIGSNQFGFRPHTNLNEFSPTSRSNAPGIIYGTNTGLPPGLQKRDQLAPGLQKRDQLPPGLNRDTNFPSPPRP